MLITEPNDFVAKLPMRWTWRRRPPLGMRAAATSQPPRHEFWPIGEAALADADQALRYARGKTGKSMKGGVRLFIVADNDCFRLSDALGAC
jgi:hypothetical protein